MYFKSERRITTRNPAGTVVAVFNHGAGTCWYDVLGMTDRYGQPAVDEHRCDRGIAGDIPPDRIWHFPARGVGQTPLVSAGLDEQIDPEP